jgi:site-specific DNA recombinase
MKKKKVEENYIYTKALIYCRVSSDRQVKEGHGLDSQDKRCSDYATTKKYSIENVFRDEGVTGSISDRPGIRSLIAFIDEHPLDNYVVIFDDLSRLARDVVVYTTLKQILIDRNCKLESPNFQFEDTEENELMQNVTSAFNQYDRKKNRRQVIQKMKARMDNGYWCLCPPTGFKSSNDPQHGKLIKLIPPYSDIFKEAFQKYDQNLFNTLDEVRRFIKAKYDSSSIIHPISVHGVSRILSNPLYAGYLEYKPWNIPIMKAKHEGIISFDLYQRVQDKLLGKSKPQARKDYNLDFPLRGYVICEPCQKSLTGSWSKGRNDRYANYHCKSKDCVYYGKSIQRTKIESEFESILEELKPQSDILDFSNAILKDVWKEKISKNQKDKHINSHGIETLQEQIDALITRISKANNEAVIGEYEKQIDKISSQKKNLEQNISSEKYTDFEFGTALKEVKSYIESPINWWKSDNYNNQVLLLQTFFEEKLSYDKETGFGTINLSLPAKVFMAKDIQNINLVEMAGVEPASG